LQGAIFGHHFTIIPSYIDLRYIGWNFFEISERLNKNDVGNVRKMAWIFYEKEDIVGKVLIC